MASGGAAFEAVEPKIAKKAPIAKEIRDRLSRYDIPSSSILVRINEHKADIVLDSDFIPLRAEQIGQEPDHARGSIGPGLERPRPQSFGAPRGEHAYADALDNLPDAVEVTFIAHTWRKPKIPIGVPGSDPNKWASRSRMGETPLRHGAMWHGDPNELTDKCCSLLAANYRIVGAPKPTVANGARTDSSSSNLCFRK